MNASTPLYIQLLGFFRQYSRAKDWRHLKTLGWMVSALIGSGKLSLPAWEPHVTSKATQAQSFERRWRRFLTNKKINTEHIYIPLVMAALSQWKNRRLYLAIDTTVLWDKYCMIHVSVVCCGRAIPLLWDVLEHESATVAFLEYIPLLRKARWLLRKYPDVMLLADRAFASHDLMAWLEVTDWHYSLRLKCDVLLHGVNRHPIEVGRLYPPINQAKLLKNVGLWADGIHRTNLVLATVKGAKDSWAVITDEVPSLQTLCHYSSRFCVEELFLDSKSGAFGLEDSRLRHTDALKRLYLIAAVALLYATTTGMTVTMTGLRTTVDPHWRRGLSYLKIGLRYLRGVINKGRALLVPVPLFSTDPEPCFASNQARPDLHNSIWFSRIVTITCKT
jgi:Transposase DDE domain